MQLTHNTLRGLTLHLKPVVREGYFEFVGLVDASGIVCIFYRGAVKRVRSRLRIEQNSLARASVAFDDSGVTPACAYAHVVANLHTDTMT